MKIFFKPTKVTWWVFGILVLIFVVPVFSDFENLWLLSFPAFIFSWILFIQTAPLFGGYNPLAVVTIELVLFYLIASYISRSWYMYKNKKANEASAKGGSACLPAGRSLAE